MKEIVLKTKEEYIKYLKEQIKDLFNKEGIGLCYERYCNTIESVYKSEENIISIYCSRLIQGGIFIYPSNESNLYNVQSNIKDNEVESLLLFSSQELRFDNTKLSLNEIINNVLKQYRIDYCS